MTSYRNQQVLEREVKVCEFKPATLLSFKYILIYVGQEKIYSS